MPLQGLLFFKQSEERLTNFLFERQTTFFYHSKTPLEKNLTLYGNVFLKINIFSCLVLMAMSQYPALCVGGQKHQELFDFRTLLEDKKIKKQG